MLTLGGTRRDGVPDHEPGDAVERDLRERDHPSVAEQEDQAGRRDPVPEHLGQKGVREEIGEEEGSEQRDHEDHGADPPLGERGRAGTGSGLQPGLPNRPWGRNASTIASRANVKTTEYCVQQSLPVVGR